MADLWFPLSELEKQYFFQPSISITSHAARLLQNVRAIQFLFALVFILLQSNFDPEEELTHSMTHHHIKLKLKISSF